MVLLSMHGKLLFRGEITMDKRFFIGIVLATLALYVLYGICYI